MKKGVFTMIFFFCLVTTVSVVTLSGCELTPNCSSTVTRINNVNADLVHVADIYQDANGYAHYSGESFPYGLASTTYDSIGFEISFDLVSAFIQGKTTLPFMFNGAYACSESFYVTDNIVSINIKSDADYDNLHQSGTSLNDIFEVYNGFLSSGSFPIDEYIENNIYYYDEIMLLMSSVAPEFERTHTFSIEITLEGGSVFSQKLDPVTIKI